MVRPKTLRTRPMPDRVKAAIFSMLGSYYGIPGGLPLLRVADAFAGSGAMGLEALSRGAAACWFFERDRDALQALNRNRQTLAAEDRAAVIVKDAWAAGVLAPDGQPFELILLDPPYRDALDVTECGAVRRFLARVAQREDNRPLIVLHHPAKVRFALPPEDAWRVIDERRFGTNAITLFSR